MRRILSTVFISLIFILNGFSQTKKEVWSKVKISLSPQQNMRKLSGLGVETDHGQLKAGYWFISDFSSAELKKIRQAGFQTEILIPDVQEDFLKRNAAVRETKSLQVEY
jgi:hypothetical protein